MTTITAEALRLQADPYLAPISDAAPTGSNASFDPRYESLRSGIAALDSPSGGEVDWAAVEKTGRELLTTASKDLLVASYTTYALFENHGLPGLALGVEVLRGILDRYWDGLFPPLPRMRGRGNALDWLVARLEIRLPALSLVPSDRPALELVIAGFGALATEAREKLGEHCPGMRGVSEALERLALTFPAEPTSTPGGPPPSATPATRTPATAPDPAPAGATSDLGPATVPAPASAGADARTSDPVGRGPVEPTPAADGDAVREPPTPPPAPGRASTSQPTAADDPLAAARAEAERWLSPIRGAEAAGADARYEPEYEAARSEVGKLEAVTGGEPEWAVVERSSGIILEKKAKDLLMASYLAVARLQQHGLTSLPTSLVVIDGLLDRYGDRIFPSRPRGRGNALDWLVSQLDLRLGGIQPKQSDRAALLLVEKAVKALSSRARDALGENAPAMGSLTERVQRMLLSVPEVASRPKPAPEPMPTQPPPAPAPPSATPSASVSTARPVMPAPTATVSEGEDVGSFLLETGRNLVTAAGILRRARSSNATAYRLLRVGLWLHLQGPPPSDAGGKTQIPPLPGARRQQFETIAANQKWEALLEETESAVQQFRFCLDLNRMSHTALVGLGPSHAEAATALVAEVGTLLRRMPGLVDLTAADGSPLADDDTRRWIDEHVSSAPASSRPAADGDDDEAFTTIRGLLKGGKGADALTEAKKRIDHAPSERERFIRRLTLAEICLDGGQALLARGMFAALERELQERGLTAWEPALAGRCLEGFVRSIRATAKAGKPYDGADAVFERLCLVDPATAAKLAT